MGLGCVQEFLTLVSIADVNYLLLPIERLTYKQEDESWQQKDNSQARLEMAA
ncbi:MAG: hypothetical protein ABIB71_09235 [Candidatus Woesearchaeota archaeon]